MGRESCVGVCECERMMEETIRAGVFTMCHLIASTHSALSHAAGPPPISQVIFVTLVYWKIPLIPFKEVTTVRGGEGQSGRDGVKERDDPFWRRSSQSEQTHFCPLQDAFCFSLARIAGVRLRFHTASWRRGNLDSGSPRRKTDERERRRWTAGRE